MSRRPCLRCVDALWMLEEGGETLENAATRLGIERDSLITHLRRAGLGPRIARQLERDRDQFIASRMTTGGTR